MTIAIHIKSAGYESPIGYDMSLINLLPEERDLIIETLRARPRLLLIVDHTGDLPEYTPEELQQ